MMSSITAIGTYLAAALTSLSPPGDLEQKNPAEILPDPAPSVSPPETRTNPPAVALSIECKDGAIIHISESEINPPDGPRLLYLQNKYKNMMRRIASVDERGELKGFTIHDPALNILYLTEVALSETTLPESVEKRLLALDNRNEDKAFLLIIFALALSTEGLITAEKVENLLLKAHKIAPDNAEVNYELYKYYIVSEKLDTAYPYLIKSNPPPEEYVQYYLLKSDLAKKEKKYDAALNYLQEAEKHLPDRPEFAAELLKKRADIYYLQKEYREALKALKQAAKTFESLAEAHPEDLALQLRLAGVYLLLYRVNDHLPGRNIAKTGLIQNWEYNTAESCSKLEDTLEKIETLDREKKEYLSPLANLYLSIGETEKAISLLKELSQKEPDNTAVPLQLGDLLLSRGEIDAAFQYYAGALSAAQKNLTLLSELHLRFSFLSVQTKMALAHLKAGKTTPLQAGLNILATTLIGYFNPFFAVANIAGAGIKAAADKSFSQKDLEKIIDRSDALKASAFEGLKTLAAEEQDGRVFLLMVEFLTGRIDFTLQQVKRMEEDTFAREEEIEEYKKILKEFKEQSLAVYDASFAEFLTLDAPPQIFFELYFLLREKKDKKAGSAFARGAEALRKMNNFRAFQIGAQILPHLPKKKQSVIIKIMAEAFKAALETARKNNDFATLLELGQKMYLLGPFSRRALETTIDMAGSDNARLFEIGAVISRAWRREEGNDLARILDVKKNLRELSVRAYRKILENSSGDEKMLACRELWLLGDYETAYLGYVSMLEENKNNREKTGQLFYELGMMAAARGKNEKAEEWFRRALPLFRDELDYLKSGAAPDYFAVRGATFLAPLQIRANMILYLNWTVGEPSPDLLAQSVSDLYAANSKRATAVVSVGDDGEVIEVKEQTIDRIEISGNAATSTAAIIARLSYNGLKAGDLLSADIEETYQKITEASNDLKTFTIKESKVEVREGKTVVKITVEESADQIYDFSPGIGIGNTETFVHLKLAYNSLFGGGERIGLDYSYHWFHAEGCRNFKDWNGQLYYFDPALFVVGGNTPVSGGINLERRSRIDFDHKTMERMTGGGFSLGVKIARRTTLTASPRFYYVEGEENYYRPSLKITLEKDGRDNYLFPNSGYYLKSSVEPGMRVGGASSFFANQENEARFYTPLPLGMVLALRGAAGIGYHLFGGDKYSLGGNIFNPYVRGGGGAGSAGIGVAAASAELRAPLIRASRDLKMQFYGFGDSGLLIGANGSPALFSTGGGLRINLPLIGLLNTGWAFPGGPFIWFGDLGWN